MPKIELIGTGVPGLDQVLGGGLPTLSFNVIGGDPGAGKTTLAQQVLFANATAERPALFFTLVGEPALKMLRYQQQFSFFDVNAVGRSIHYQDLSEDVLRGELESVFTHMMEQVERIKPAFVVVDSFRSVARIMEEDPRVDRPGSKHFIQRLSQQMTRWEATTFLLGTFQRSKASTDAILTVADSLFWLRHAEHGDSRVRKLEVSKLRGRAEQGGKHIYRLTSDGIRVYPRALSALPSVGPTEKTGRLSTGVPGLDAMMGGGLVRGDAAIVSGPSGSGKSVLGMQFAEAGIRAGEPVVIATFEESSTKYRSRAAMLGMDLEGAERDGLLRMLDQRPLDLAVDETFEELRDVVEELGAARVVIDSLSGLEVAAPDADLERLRESAGRIVHTLTEAGVTVLMTVELDQRADSLRFTPHESSFLADDIILQRYVEIRGRLETVLTVIKMRRSDHSRVFRRYDVGREGLVMGEILENLHGILTGVPDLGRRLPPATDREPGGPSPDDDGDEG